MIKIFKTAVSMIFCIFLSGCVPQKTTSSSANFVGPTILKPKVISKPELTGCKDAAVRHLSKEGYEPVYAATPLKGSLLNAECRVDIYAKKDGVMFATAQELNKQKELLSLDIFDVPFYKFEINFAKNNAASGVALAIVLEYYEGAEIALVASDDRALENFHTLSNNARSEFLQIYPEFKTFAIVVNLEKIDSNGRRAIIKTVKF